jgi:hypothetical protein
MLSKKIAVGSKEFEIKELKYKDLLLFSGLPDGESSKKMMLLCTGISEEEYNDLSMSEGIAIQKVINEVNGLSDFQKTLAESKTN